MERSFDPYRKWLGIPPEEQPPNHYRLLGIALYEDDPDVIGNAADRQMAHVRTYQTGKHSALSQTILNQLSAAKLCLLNEDRKSAYDAQLRQELAARATPPPPQPAKSPARPTPVRPAPVRPVAVDPVAAPEPDAVSVTRSISVSAETAALGSTGPRIRSKRRRRRSSVLPMVFGGSAAGVLLLMLIIFVRGQLDLTETAERHRSPSATDSQTSPGVLPKDVARSDFDPAKDPAEPKTPPAVAPDQKPGDSPMDAPDATSKPDTEQVPDEPRPDGRDSHAKPGDSTEDVPDGPKDAAADPKETDPKDSPDGPKDSPGDPKDSPDDPKDSPDGSQDTGDDSQDSQPPLDESPDSEKSDEMRKAPQQPIARRLPVPNRAELDRAAQQVRDDYRARLTNARTPAQRAAVAQEMVREAGVERNRVRKYALLDVARNISVTLFNWDAFCGIVDYMAESFDIDPLMEKRLSYEEASKQADNEARIVRDLDQCAQQLIDEAVKQERFDMALAVARLARVAARRADAGFAEADARGREIEALEREHRAYVRSKETLESDPDDPAANLTVGRYFIVVHRDWEQGLPLVAKGPASAGSDDLLREAAELELAKPGSPQEQMALGDVWVTYGKRRRGVHQVAAYERAKYWFESARETIDDAELPNLDNRLAEVTEFLSSGL